MKRQLREEARIDLTHWGHVARRRLRAEPRKLHPIAQIMQLGIVSGPTQYVYEYEPDEWFRKVNLVVIQLPEEHKAVLIAHYIDRKPWKLMRRLMALDKWWQVGRVVREAEARYIASKLNGYPDE